MNAGAAFLSSFRPASLTPGDVQVWHFRLEVDGNAETALARVLDDQERSRAERFRFTEHRRRFIVRRAMLRLILSRYADVAPEKLRYASGNKPTLAWPDKGLLKFSASSSGELGAVAVTLERELGLDVEQVRANRDHDLIASSEFSAEESDWLRRLPDIGRLDAFYRLWTCKEAYLKGKGVGLTASLKDFAVSMNQETPRLLWSKLDDADPEQWSLQMLSMEPGFAACLAVEGGCRAVRSERGFVPETPAVHGGEAAC